MEDQTKKANLEMSASWEESIYSVIQPKSGGTYMEMVIQFPELPKIYNRGEEISEGYNKGIDGRLGHMSGGPQT
jgi:hypothetical protein